MQTIKFIYYSTKLTILYTCATNLDNAINLHNTMEDTIKLLAVNNKLSTLNKHVLIAMNRELFYNKVDTILANNVKMASK